MQGVEKDVRREKMSVTRRLGLVKRVVLHRLDRGGQEKDGKGRDGEVRFGYRGEFRQGNKWNVRQHKNEDKKDIGDEVVRFGFRGSFCISLMEGKSKRIVTRRKEQKNEQVSDRGLYFFEVEKD